jgi:hypothetical protein
MELAKDRVKWQDLVLAALKPSGSNTREIVIFRSWLKQTSCA